VKSPPDVNDGAPRYYAPRLYQTPTGCQGRDDASSFSREEMHEFRRYARRIFKARRTDAHLVGVPRLDVRRVALSQSRRPNTTDVLGVSDCWTERQTPAVRFKTVKMHLKDETSPATNRHESVPIVKVRRAARFCGWVSGMVRSADGGAQWRRGDS